MRRPILLLLSLALLLGLGGCMPYVRQTPEEETTLITVGFSQVGAESDWRVANTESMRESLSEENGFELLFDNARQKQENQFKAIRTASSNGTRSTSRNSPGSRCCWVSCRPLA